MTPPVEFGSVRPQNCSLWLCHNVDKTIMTSPQWVISADPGCWLRGKVETQQSAGLEKESGLESSSGLASGSGAEWSRSLPGSEAQRQLYPCVTNLAPIIFSSSMLTRSYHASRAHRLLELSLGGLVGRSGKEFHLDVIDN